MIMSFAEEEILKEAVLILQTCANVIGKEIELSREERIIIESKLKEAAKELDEMARGD